MNKPQEQLEETKKAIQQTDQRVVDSRRRIRESIEALSKLTKLTK